MMRCHHKNIAYCHRNHQRSSKIIPGNHRNHQRSSKIDNNVTFLQKNDNMRPGTPGNSRELPGTLRELMHFGNIVTFLQKNHNMRPGTPGNSRELPGIRLQDFMALLSPHQYGLPQQRVRVYILGIRQDALQPTVTDVSFRHQLEIVRGSLVGYYVQVHMWPMMWVSNMYS